LPALAVATASILAIAAATLGPLPGQATQSAVTPFLCLPCGETGGADLILNIVLFLPLGLSLAALGWSGMAAAMSGFALSGLVEALQYLVIPGRDASLGDLVANTAGAAVGWALWASRDMWLRPSPAVARRLGAAWVLGVGALLGFTHWALHSDLSGSTWYGQWGGEPPEFFTGQVLEVRLGGVKLRHWRIPESVRRGATRAADTVLLEAVIRTGPTAVESGRVLSVADSVARFVSFGQHGDDLTFGIRTRSAKLRLLAPRFLLDQGMKAKLGDTLELRGQYADGRASVESQGTRLRSMDVQLTALDSWVFFWPGAVRHGSLLLLLRTGTLVVLLVPLWGWVRWLGKRKAARLE